MPDLYGTLAGANAYHLEHGNAAWTGTDEAKTAALVRASAYVDSLGRQQMLPPGVWRTLWPGTKTGGRAQALDWPRTDASDYEGNAIGPAEIPIEVVHATYEAALRELTAPGSLNPDYTPSALVKREKAGPWEEEYFEPGAGANPNQPVISIILDLLAPLLGARLLPPAIMVV
jgi:hypothetical protein